MPAGDPASGLAKAKALVMRWTSTEADEEVKAAIMAAEVIPITGSFLSTANKDANRYSDLRAGTILPVHFIPRGDERGFSNQDSIIVLAMDYAGFICAKSFLCVCVKFIP